MNTFYYHDIEYNNCWYGLSLTVKSSFNSKPPVYFCARTNSRLTLLNGDSPLLWITQAKDYGGAWVIRNWSSPENRISFIPPITSQDVEQRKHLTGDESLKSWSRLFIKQLTNSPNHFLYHSDWLLQGLKGSNHDTGINSITKMRKKGLLESTTPYGLELPTVFLTHHDISAPIHSSLPCVWVSWWDAETPLIALNQIQPESGRLKWWRKKTRENSLPPIFVWRVSCLDAYLLIDGHYRLQAALLENKLPDIIVITAVSIEHIPADKRSQQKILNSLLMPRPSHKPISISTLNQIMISTFAQRSYVNWTTRSWSTKTTEQQWVNEVTERLAATEQAELINDILQRKG